MKRSRECRIHPPRAAGKIEATNFLRRCAEDKVGVEDEEMETLSSVQELAEEAREFIEAAAETVFESPPPLPLVLLVRKWSSD